MFSESDLSLRKRDIQDRRLSIIDVSSADDSLLDPVSENHHSTENEDENADLWYTPNSKKFEDAATKIEQWEHEPQSSGAGKSKKNTKCNLRKSLAWDSAFFTSAGVLDAEELSSIIEGVEKEPLPMIEEDVYKSCDSISTIMSNSLTLESVDMEGDLFEDVRASIQKSSHKSKLASAAMRVSSTSGLPGFQTREASRKVDIVSRNKMKASPASRTPSAGMRRIVKTTTNSNSTFTHPQSVATRRESSVSKQSKVPAKPSAGSTISSKRESLGDRHVKSERDKAKQTIGGRISSVPKASIIGRSRGTEPKPGLLSKSTSGPSVSTKTRPATSTSSGRNLSDNIAKSPFNSAKRNINVGNSKPPPSRPPVKTPSRFASRSNTESGNSSLSSLMSVNKLSSSVSPASSVSDWSSESSVSTSMPKHGCDSSRSSIDSNSSRRALLDTNAYQGINSQIRQSDSSLEEQEAQHSGFISQSVKLASVATVIPSAPGKPSGLRLPSPKIGFFDGVKSSVRTPRGGMQPHSAVPHGLPKHGAGRPSEAQHKPKLGKPQPVRSITSIDNKRADNQQNLHPTHCYESLDVAIKTSSGKQNVEYTLHSERTHHGVNNQKMVQEDNQVDYLSKQVGLMDIDSKQNVEYTLHSERTHHGVNNQKMVQEDNQADYLSKQVGLMDIDSKQNVEYTLHSEKTHHGVNNLKMVQEDDQVDYLSKQVGLMDINSKTWEKTNGDSLSLCQTDVSFKDNGLESSSHKELFDNPKNQELLNGSFTPCMSVSPTSFCMATSESRRPFATIDSICNMDCSDLAESTVSKVKPTNLPKPESITTENS